MRWTTRNGPSCATTIPTASIGVMAGYAREVRRTTQDELAQLKAKGADVSMLQAAKRWLHRDDDRVPAAARPNLMQARAAHPALDKMATMREELRQLWVNAKYCSFMA